MSVHTYSQAAIEQANREMLSIDTKKGRVDSQTYSKQIDFCFCPKCEEIRRGQAITQKDDSFLFKCSRCQRECTAEKLGDNSYAPIAAKKTTQAGVSKLIYIFMVLLDNEQKECVVETTRKFPSQETIKKDKYGKIIHSG